MLVVEGKGTPLAEHIDSASPAEVTLLVRTLAKVSVPCAGRPGRPRCRMPRVLADAGYDSDPLRAQVWQHGTELIAPHRSNRVRPATLDGRTARRLKRRWAIERTNAWLQTFRRVATRFDHSLLSYTGFVHLACAMITLNRLLKGL